MAKGEPGVRRMDQRDALECYVGEHGHVCLKQQSGVDEPAIIVLELEQIQTVIKWLQDVAEEAADHPENART